MTLSALGIFSAAGAGGVSLSDYELISTTLFSGSTSSVDFDVSALASTYKHLQLRVVGRTARAAGTDALLMRFNSDTGSNYNGHYLGGDGSTVYSGFVASTTYTYTNLLGNSVDTTNFMGVSVIDILDIFSNSKNTTVRALDGAQGTPKYMNLSSGLWRNTNTVTAINLSVFSGSNLLSNSRISLYGIKG